MLAMFGIGIVVGMILVFALLKATMSTEPAGCILILGTILLLFILTLLVGPWLALG